MLPIHFAPLQGYTEDAYRRLHHQRYGGVTEYYTPFLRLEGGKVRPKDLRDIAPQNNVGVPLTVQLIAASADELQTLLDVVRPLGYRRIDINMGCPFPLQTRHGRGAGLLPHPDRVAALCRAMGEASDLTFSVKMRLGLASADEWQAIMPILNDTPLRHIAMHPRIASQGYKGECDREAFLRFLSASRHPVVYNGDITTLQHIDEMERLCQEAGKPLAGIMLGRGLLAQPWLARCYNEHTPLPDSEAAMASLREFHSLMQQHFQGIIPGEAQYLTKLRTFWDFCEPVVGRKRWKKIVKAGNIKNYLAAIYQG